MPGIVTGAWEYPHELNKRTNVPAPMKLLWNKDVFGAFGMLHSLLDYVGERALSS